MVQADFVDETGFTQTKLTQVIAESTSFWLILNNWAKAWELSSCARLLSFCSRIPQSPRSKPILPRTTYARSAAMRRPASYSKGLLPPQTAQLCTWSKRATLSGPHPVRP